MLGRIIYLLILLSGGGQLLFGGLQPFPHYRSALLPSTFFDGIDVKMVAHNSRIDSNHVLMTPSEHVKVALQEFYQLDSHLRTQPGPYF